MPTNPTIEYQAICFDMDGTLIDSEPLWLKSEIELMAEFGYEWSRVDQEYCLGGPLSKVGAYMAEKAGWSDVRSRLICRKIAAASATFLTA